MHRLECKTCQEWRQGAWCLRIAYGLKCKFPERPQMPEIPHALQTQVAGNHYSKLKIQPIAYTHANNIPFAEGSVIKYVTRWRDKGGIEDLRKAKHFIEMLIELETPK